MWNPRLRHVYAVIALVLACVFTVLIVVKGGRALAAGKPTKRHVPAGSSSTVYVYQSQFGLQTFTSPQGISVDQGGDRYVADQGTNLIYVFDPLGNPASPVASFGSGQLTNPADVSVDPNNFVYVADSGGPDVQRFSTTGTPLGGWNTWNSTTEPPPFSNPRAIAANGTIVAVADTNRFRILIFDPVGNFQAGWPVPSGGAPRGVAIDAAGNVYASDYTNNQIFKFDQSGNVLGQWGSTGSGNGELQGPGDLAIDSSGNLFVVDSGNYRIEVFDTAGNYLSQFGSQGTNPGQFSSIGGVAVDLGGTVDVTDSANGVEVFFPVAATATPTATSTVTPTSTNGGNPTPTPTRVSSSGSHVYLPAVFVPPLSPTPAPNAIQNGGFDSGLADWQTGESGGFSAPTASTLGDNDTTAALLGNPGYTGNPPNTCGGGVPVGGVWISQQVTVPAGSPTLSFEYNLWTQGNAGGSQSAFDVYVNGTDDSAHRLFRSSSQNVGNGCANPAQTNGWQSGSASLSAYAGQTITLYFGVFQYIPNNNTYVYLDSVAINP